MESVFDKLSSFDKPSFRPFSDACVAPGIGTSPSDAVCEAGSGSERVPATMSASQSPSPEGTASTAVWGL